MNTHGGPRKGAGRPPGSKAKLSRKTAEELAETGVMPLTVMVETMRDLWSANKRLEACAIAEKCAPYMHPRLSAVDHSGSIETPTVMRLPEVMDSRQAWLNQTPPAKNAQTIQ